MGRKPIGKKALTNAERQRRWRAAHRPEPQFKDDKAVTTLRQQLAEAQAANAKLRQQLEAAAQRTQSERVAEPYEVRNLRSRLTDAQARNERAIGRGQEAAHRE